MAAALTATERGLRARYPHAVRNAFAGAIVFHLLLFVFSPPFDFKPYEPPPEPPVRLVSTPEFDFPKPPEDVAHPEHFVPEPAPDGEDVDLPVTSPVDFSEYVPQPPPGGGVTDPFLAFDEPPVPVHLAQPVYPELARETGIEGAVTIEVLVGVDGTVLEAKIVSSDVTRAMERSALEAAMRCRFKAARQGNQPVKARMAIPVMFRLR